MKYFSSILIAFISAIGIYGQEEEEFKEMSKIDVNGYISEMPSVNWNSDSTVWQGLLHNRINIDWYPSASLTGSLQIRNQVLVGDVVELMNIENGIKKDNYALPLTLHQVMGDNYLLSMAIDRAWLQYTKNKLEIKLGRQRINWGQTFVWNPNDIFNSYNFFDFDYPERPGADALRITYYPNYNSSVEAAAKVDSSGNIIGGGLYRFTKWNTEFQLLGGYFSKKNETFNTNTMQLENWEDKDLVTGLGFSGGLKGVSLRSEMSYLYSLKKDNDSTNQFMVSMTVDYTLANEVGLMFEAFYVSKKNLSIVSLLSSSGGSQDIKSLAFTKYNFFGQASYPIMPILNGSLAGMCYFDEDMFGFYAGPSLDLSLGDNLTMGAIFQIFAFRYEDPSTLEDTWGNLNYAYLRLKWNF